MPEAPALVVRFAADGSVVSTTLTFDDDVAPRWTDAHVAGLTSRWATFGPAVLDGADRTFVWELGDRSLVTAAGRVVGDDAASVVSLLVETATLDVTDLRAGRSDPLTGLSSRETLVDRLDAVIRSLRHDPSPAGVAVVALGHEVEPQEMVAAAEQLEQTIRGGDLVGRLGPDELAVVFGTAISETEARVAASRVLGVLADHPDVRIGLAFAESPVSATGLIDEAQAAVDLARTAGTRVYVVDDVDRDQLEWTTRRVDDLRLAVELDQFEVRYQPVVQLADGLVRSYEALVRWIHPTDGLIAPDEFVPLAERTGLIEGVTSRVLEHVLGDLERLHAGDATGGPTLAVNVAATDLLRIGFVADLVAQLAAGSVPSSALRLELTERSALADVQRAIRVMGDLRAVGIGVSLDDFGTGASTLSVLRDLPVDCLKVDRSFVSGLPASDDDRAVVRLIVGLAGQLGLSVVAEGIETQEQLDALADLGCELGQGYVFGPAVSGDELG